MKIDQNQTNIPPVGSKSSGFSAIQQGDEKRTKENVIELVEAKSLSEAKQVKQAEKQLDVRKAEKETEANAKTEVELKDLSSVVAKINEQVQSIQRDLVFSIDEESGREVVTIKDSNSDKVIRQIPSEEMLQLARNLNEQLDAGDNVKAVNLFSSIA
mgnify:CR=1 FL=1